eukprot:GHVU01115033.1.p1 GENE.GHVU01115033.1~~GHVU01115033.1.p1  ORF type:complete len:197 (-),score=23.30 GHVU01115033.1:173-763(-)
MIPQPPKNLTLQAQFQHSAEIMRQIKENPNFLWRYSCVGNGGLPSCYSEFDYSPEEVRWAFRRQADKRQWDAAAQRLEEAYELSLSRYEIIYNKVQQGLPIACLVSNYAKPPPLAELIKNLPVPQEEPKEVAVEKGRAASREAVVASSAAAYNAREFELFRIPVVPPPRLDDAQSQSPSEFDWFLTSQSRESGGHR